MGNSGLMSKARCHAEWNAATDSVTSYPNLTLVEARSGDDAYGHLAGIYHAHGGTKVGTILRMFVTVNRVTMVKHRCVLDGLRQKQRFVSDNNSKRWKKTGHPDDYPDDYPSNFNGELREVSLFHSASEACSPCTRSLRCPGAA
jgi:hypothetical protein